MSYTLNPKLKKYLQALQEATGESYELALGHLRIAGKKITAEKARELGGKNREGVRKLLDSWFGKYLTDEVKNLLIILQEEDSLELLGELEEKEKSEEVVVKTPHKLDEETRGWIRKEMEGRNITFREDASLIGGVQIKVGDKEVDNSVRARLSAIFS